VWESESRSDGQRLKLNLKLKDGYPKKTANTTEVSGANHKKIIWIVRKIFDHTLVFSTILAHINI